MTPFDPADWPPTRALRDVSDQVEDANEAARAEIASQRREDVIEDDRPSGSELAEDDRYWRERDRNEEWWA